MPKLYFKWGCMNSSKSAQALMTKFNYTEKGYSVALMKPSVDRRGGADVIRSRIGLATVLSRSKKHGSLPVVPGCFPKAGCDDYRRGAVSHRQAGGTA